MEFSVDQHPSYSLKVVPSAGHQELVEWCQTLPAPSHPIKIAQGLVATGYWDDPYIEGIDSYPEKQLATRVELLATTEEQVSHIKAQLVDFHLTAGAKGKRYDCCVMRPRIVGQEKIQWGLYKRPGFDTVLTALQSMAPTITATQLAHFGDDGLGDPHPDFAEWLPLDSSREPPLEEMTKTKPIKEGTIVQLVCYNVDLAANLPILKQIIGDHCQ